MRVIERYILVQLAGIYGLISLLLLGLFGFFDLTTQLDDVGKGIYTTADAIRVTLYGLPQRLVDLMPFTALLTTVVTLGIMAQRRELVILRGAGISPLRVGATIVKLGALLLAANVVLQCTVAPGFSQRGNQLHASAVAGHRAGGANGFWVRSRDGIMHIGGLHNGRAPTDVEFFVFDDGHSLSRYMSAASADIFGPGDWQLHHVLIKHFAAGGYRSERRADLTWRPALYPGQLQLLRQPPATLSPQSLYRYIRYLEHQGRHAQTFRVALWQKLAALFTTLAMMLFAIPLAFANPRGTNLGLRLIAAGLIGLAVYATGQASANLALLLDVPPAPLLLAPAAAFIVAALVWLRRLS